MADDVLVLSYHAVSRDWEAALSVTPDALERQLTLLSSRGYVGATFHDAITAPRPGRTVVVTFDDAYRSVHAIARPILARLGLPATVFAPTSFIGSEQPMSWPGVDHWLGGPHEGELVPMSWEELGDLAEAGWEIGSHTRTHPHLPRLSDGEVRDELRGSRGELEDRLGDRCESLAYPYGDHDPRIVAQAHDAGYRAAASISSRLHEPEALRWPRAGVYHGDGELTFRLKASPTTRRLRRSRLTDGIVQARGALRRRRAQPRDPAADDRA